MITNEKREFEMAEVKLEKIEKVYPNGFKAVHGVDLHIQEGEFMVLVGPSGCAKSTCLRMVAGLEEISGGTLKIGNKIVNDLEPKDREIAMVFQNYALYPHMTVFDNMAFGLKLKKIPKKEIRERVVEAAKKLEIEDLLDRKPKDMSGGQRQRVAIGRAIVRKPKVFLFDEPLSNLDAKLRVSMRVRIKQLHKQLQDEGQTATMIYVTHDQVEAMTMGDRICVLKTGEIMQVAEPLTLYNSPANKFVAGFIGSPAMNIKEGVLKVDKDSLKVDVHKSISTIPENKVKAIMNSTAAGKLTELDGKKVFLGIRPEHIGTKVTAPGKTEYHQGEISAIEQMGNEEYIYFTMGGERFTSRVSSDKTSKIAIGDKEEFYFNIDKAHIFDFETEQNLSI